MRILDIEKLFQSEATLCKVLEECEKDFENIDYWAGLMKEGVVHNNPAEINKSLTSLAGSYSNLRVILGLAETELANREVRNYGSIKMKSEADGKKFTAQIDSATKKEASEAVCSYRRIRNIILGYLTSADKDIITLQNVNNNLDKNLRKHPSE